MHALPLALVLAAVAAPAPVPEVDAAPQAPVRPTMVVDEPASSAAIPTPSPSPSPSPSPAVRPTAPAAPKPASAPVPQPAVEKLGQGDRAFLAGDYRTALFAYQDAVYLAPRSAVARVRLGRAYLALRYPPKALEQAQQALALDPENQDARQLASDASAAPARPVAPAGAAVVGGPPPQRNGASVGAHANGVDPAVAPKNGGATAGPRVYPFTAEPDAAPRPAPSAPAAAAVVPVAGAIAISAAAPSTTPASTPATTATPAQLTAPAPPSDGLVAAVGLGAVAVASARPADEAAAAPPSPSGAPAQLAAVQVEGAPTEPARAAPAPSGPTAGQRYRTALELLASREFEKAQGELTQAIVLDPRLAVAYSARGSARFGLARYREAADDYQTALTLDANLGTPLYGLAECFRMLGDARRASEMYQRYADSRAPDVREDLRAMSARRAQELK